MVLLGTLVNGLTIIIGAYIGVKLQRIPEKMKETVMKAIGLAVIILGITMALDGQEFLLVIFSLALGGILGERMNIEGKLNQLGGVLEKRMKRGSESSNIAEGFVAATLLFVVGAMAIIGALDSGLRGDHSVLLTKSVLDGFSSIIFAATLGIGVMFSSIPVILYQGSIALGAAYIVAFVPEELLDLMVSEITAVGGIMILAIGLNIVGIKPVRVANLLPAIPLAVLFVFIINTIA
ncbi:DUF554 domain-containing protein [Bacillus sp. H-16]|uniref:DUF554 domain-containing protein n=1 Tax=Alteribacter salitolerans TaxID=2912333 RepID=UPI00196512D9|nr:DUF554 domain-containing protein [Alteribacter salitolerans]MBM7095376.1 DUF554 domain-containing protein [Alteribacter salitolerans]